MECRPEHYRHILLFYFRKGKKATEAHRKICAVYGVDTIAKRTCQNWFAKFRSGDCSLKDVQRCGRPSEVDDDHVKALIEANRHITIRQIAGEINVSIGAVHKHIKKLGLVKKLDKWVPNSSDISENNNVPTNIVINQTNHWSADQNYWSSAGN